MIVWLADTIHGEVDLIRYAAEFLVEVYEIMIIYVMKTYDKNEILYARMFEDKCTKMHMNIV